MRVNPLVLKQITCFFLIDMFGNEFMFSEYEFIFTLL